MANKKYDGVIEAVHYTADGQVDWVRGYMRQGQIWTDRIILRRQGLIEAIKSGKQMMIGKRVEFMAGTFEVSQPVQVVGSNGHEFLSTTKDNVDKDHLEGVPLL